MLCALIRALFGTATCFCEGVVLKSNATPEKVVVEAAKKSFLATWGESVKRGTEISERAREGESES